MERGIGALLLLGLCTPISGTLDEDINRAIRTCRHNLDTDIDIRPLDTPQKRHQGIGRFFKYASYGGRPRHLIGRLFPWLIRPPRYQVMLTTACKQYPAASTTRPARGDSNSVIVKTCSAYLNDQQPVKYILTCNNGTREGTTEEKTAAVTTIDPGRNGANVEGSGDEQEEYMEEDNWDLSRCLGCIFGMLNK